MSKKIKRLPEKMWALRQKEAGSRLEVKEIPCPTPGPGQVLVRMSHAPVNPSDLTLLRGGYLERSYPFTPGLEGAGVVVAAGKGLLPGMRLGKEVACSPPHGGDGCWAEFMLTSAMNCVPLPLDLGTKAGSMLLVNPMTAMALIEMAQKNRHSALVNTAAASSLGKMLVRLAAARGIPLINIVRRKEQAETLKELGAEHILVSDEEGYHEHLKELSHRLDATMLLDAISGGESRMLLKALPVSAVLVSYARLAGEDMLIDPGDLIKDDKHIEGFQLGNWLSEQKLLYKLRFISRVKKGMQNELASEIGQVFPFREAENAIEHYQAHMSAGKVLLNFEG